jgi:cell division septation protein DedD
MTHDFAKIRPEPLLEKKSVQAPPAWSLLATGVVVGVALGVFGCLLLYLSGRVPPLGGSPVAVAAPTPSAAAETPGSAEEDAGVRFDFYSELPSYEVAVDVEPVPLADHELVGSEQPMPLEQPMLLQTGAFEQADRAEMEAQRQRVLGLPVLVNEQTILGRRLYLVQSGPYQDRVRLAEAEDLLRRNNIASLRVLPR